MFVRTQENYREVFKSIVGPTPDLRIFGLTLFNILVGTYLERERCICCARYKTFCDNINQELQSSPVAVNQCSLPSNGCSPCRVRLLRNQSLVTQTPKK